MAGMIRKSLDTAEEVRPFENGTGQVELVNTESVPLVAGHFCRGGAGRRM
jgi:hypothetical protein